MQRFFRRSCAPASWQPSSCIPTGCIARKANQTSRPDRRAGSCRRRFRGDPRRKRPGIRAGGLKSCPFASDLSGCDRIAGHAFYIREVGARSAERRAARWPARTRTIPPAGLSTVGELLRDARHAVRGRRLRYSLNEVGVQIERRVCPPVSRRGGGNPKIPQVTSPSSPVLLLLSSPCQIFGNLVHDIPIQALKVLLVAGRPSGPAGTASAFFGRS